MIAKSLVCGVMLALLTASAFAQDKSNKKDAVKKGDNDPKALSGISIVGNNEAPKSLYIVPWKGSDLGAETDLRSNLLDDRTAPVDKEVFMRAVGFYELSNPN